MQVSLDVDVWSEVSEFSWSSSLFSSSSVLSFSRSEKLLLTPLIISSVTVPLMPEIFPDIFVTVLTAQDNREKRECLHPLFVALSDLLEISDSVFLIILSVSSSP